MVNRWSDRRSSRCIHLVLVIGPPSELLNRPRHSPSTMTNAGTMANARSHSSRQRLVQVQQHVGDHRPRRQLRDRHFLRRRGQPAGRQLARRPWGRPGTSGASARRGPPAASPRPARACGVSTVRNANVARRLGARRRLRHRTFRARAAAGCMKAGSFKRRQRLQRRVGARPAGADRLVRRLVEAHELPGTARCGGGTCRCPGGSGPRPRWSPTGRCCTASARCRPAGAGRRWGRRPCR